MEINLLLIYAGMIATTALEESKGITFQGNYLFWITGIVIQAFAALLALVGMFAVYRMQVIQNEISQLELLKNERLFQKKNTANELESLKKYRTFMAQFKQKGVQQQIEEKQKIMIQELELDYGKIFPEKYMDSKMYITKEMLPEFIERLQQLENKIEELNRHVDNIDLTVEKMGHKISKKKGKVSQIRKQTKKTTMYVLAFLVFCLPILPLSSLQINGVLLGDLISIFLIPLIISLSILVLFNIFRTLKTII